MIKSEILREEQRILFNKYSKDKKQLGVKARLYEVSAKLDKELKKELQWNERRG